MNSNIRLVALVAGLVLLMHVTPSWGQPVCSAPGCNPTVTDANFNTAGGTGALSSVTGSSNTAFGRNALLSNTTGFANTASGVGALQSNTDGFTNTASGVNALQKNTTGGNNTASGVNTLLENSTGGNNTASGHGALLSNTTGGNNTASGFQALLFNTTATFNTASGSGALHENTTGGGNTASGGNALFFNTVGNNNTATGLQALFQNSSDERNTALGTKALLRSTGNKNIAIGFMAGSNLLSGHNNIYLGSEGVDSTEFQTMRLGKAQTRTFIAGINGASVSGATVIIDTATGQLGIATSSARHKQDIAPMGTSSEAMLQLRPVTYAYNEDSQHTKHYGLIAEEVASVYPELVTRTASGEVQTVKYQELIPMLVNELQRQHQVLQTQQQALQLQQQELAELRAIVGQGRGKVVLGGVE